jgi:hypothetical protein
MTCSSFAPFYRRRVDITTHTCVVAANGYGWLSESNQRSKVRNEREQ